MESSETGAHLVGISGGAVVALLACLESQERVQSLILSGGLARPPRWFVVQRAIVAMTPERLLGRALARSLAGGNPEFVEQAGADFVRCGKRTFVAGLRELAGVDLRLRLAEVAVPTLVLCGSDDRPNVPLSEQLAASIPGAELRIVPRANHLWNLQQPELFTRTVEDFVSTSRSI